MQVTKEILCREILTKEVQDFSSKNPYVEIWLRKKSETTKRQYLRCAIRFIQTLKANNIIESENIEELFKLADKSENLHIDTLEEFQESCEETFKEKELSSLIYNTSVAIKSFYSHKAMKYKFPKDRGNYYVEPKKEKRIPTLNDIIPFMNEIPHLRDRMVVAISSSLSPRLGTFVKYQWLHFKEVLEDIDLPCVIAKADILKGSAKEKYCHVVQIGFLSPFAKSYVKQWKEEYEKITKTKIDLNDEESLKKPFLVSIEGDTRGQALSYSALNSRFFFYKKYNIHAFRTFLSEACKSAELPKEDRELFIGHSLGKLTVAYSKHDIERLRNQFRKILRYIDPTYKEDEGILKVKESVKKVLGKDISDDEAKEIFSKVVQRFFSGDSE